MKETKKRIIATILGAVGGLLAIVGVYSPWVLISISVPIVGAKSIVLNGLGFESLAELMSLLSQVGLTGAKNAAAGFAVMFILAALILIYSIMCFVFVVLTMVKPRAGGIGLTIFGTLVTVFAIITFVIISVAIGEMQRQMQAVSWLGKLISASISISIGAGVYLCIIGGAVAVAGGIVGIRSAGSSATQVKT
jgi:hypothetical protein